MTKKITEPEGKVCIAQIGAAHGIRGEVRIKLYSDDPDALMQYGALETVDGSRKFKITSARASKTIFVCRIKGLSDRNDAEALNGTNLYIDRDKLSDLEEEEFYHSDLVGLEARLENGDVLGSIVGIHDFGAGDLLDVMPARGKGLFIPFTRDCVPDIDVSSGFVTVFPPEGLLDEADAGEKAKEGEGVDFSKSPELLEGMKKS